MLVYNDGEGWDNGTIVYAAWGALKWDGFLFFDRSICCGGFVLFGLLREVETVFEAFGGEFADVDVIVYVGWGKDEGFRVGWWGMMGN